MRTMSYQYRWIYAAGTSVFIVMAIYFVDILPLREEYQNLQKTLTELQIMQVDPVVTKVVQPSSQLQEQFLLLLNDAQVDVVDMQQDANTFDLQIDADFTHMMRLLRLFSESGSKLMIENFSLQTGADHRLRLVIRMSVNEVPLSHQYETRELSVFCPVNLQQIFTEKPMFLAKSARMLGVYQSDAEQIVIVMWPNGWVGQYAIGATIGTDAERIVAVSQSGCLLQKGDRLVVLPYQK